MSPASRHIILLCSILTLLVSGCRTAGDRVISKALSNASDQLGMSVTRHDYFPLYLETAAWLGTPYRTGGSTKSGTDCSGFVHSIIRDAYGKQITRNTRDQLQKDVTRIKKHSLREGDLVFFTSQASKGSVTHVGIYLKDHCFAHASTSKGVIISSLREDYWSQNFLTAGRIK